MSRCGCDYGGVECFVEPDPLVAAARLPGDDGGHHRVVHAVHRAHEAVVVMPDVDRARRPRVSRSCSAPTATAATRSSSSSGAGAAGIDAELVEVAAGTPIPDSLDIYLFGGGEDDPQVMAAAGMRESRPAIERARSTPAR